MLMYFVLCCKFVFCHSYSLLGHGSGWGHQASGRSISFDLCICKSYRLLSCCDVRCRCDLVCRRPWSGCWHNCRLGRRPSCALLVSLGWLGWDNICVHRLGIVRYLRWLEHVSEQQLLWYYVYNWTSFPVWGDQTDQTKIAIWPYILYTIYSIPFCIAFMSLRTTDWRKTTCKESKALTLSGLWALEVFYEYLYN